MDFHGSLAAYASSDVAAAVARSLTGQPDDTLLRRAARGLATVCLRELRTRAGRVTGRRVVLLVGTGHNGADALLAGIHLRDRGAAVSAVLVGDDAYGPGVARLRAVGGAVLRAREPAGHARALAALARADLVVDGIVGDRGSGGLREPAGDLVAAIPAGAGVVAVDLPSGVDPDTGEVSEARVTADVTVTFGAYKACLLLPPGCRAAGRVEFVDVGITDELGSAVPLARRLLPSGVAARWPVPAPTDHKYLRGVLGVVAGSDTYPGAAVLACLGAYRAGVGIVRYIGPAGVRDHVLTATPEAVPGLGQVQAWLLGSGVENDPDQDAAITTALESGQPCVVDAGALQACVQQRHAGGGVAAAANVLLTPHAGEVTRMLTMLGHEVSRADVEARPLHHAHWLAREADATVLLKGHTTVVADPSGAVTSQSEASAWLATAGSGDVLAGAAGALMAGGVSAMDAGAMAASVHGMAATAASAGGPISAAQSAEALPATIAALLQPG